MKEIKLYQKRRRARKFFCSCIQSANEKNLPCKRCGTKESPVWWATCSGFVIDGVLCDDCHWEMDDCLPKELKNLNLSESERKKLEDELWQKWKG